ncbi:hypothetical protein C7M84_007470 [Penaeus vannamei]|uniref:Uncharacterized protein n=1 Tax=Penaeus vannamei TaxID=6689 RepID=A0A3R7M674_PENVA|nr:hypothetical protein C7M84_007470 [Penaeus vannamei]
MNRQQPSYLLKTADDRSVQYEICISLSQLHYDTKLYTVVHDLAVRLSIVPPPPPFRSHPPPSPRVPAPSPQHISPSCHPPRTHSPLHSSHRLPTSSLKTTRPLNTLANTCSHSPPHPPDPLCAPPRRAPNATLVPCHLPLPPSPPALFSPSRALSPYSNRSRTFTLKPQSHQPTNNPPTPTALPQQPTRTTTTPDSRQTPYPQSPHQHYPPVNTPFPSLPLLKPLLPLPYFPSPPPMLTPPPPSPPLLSSLSRMRMKNGAVRLSACAFNPHLPNLFLAYVSKHYPDWKLDRASVRICRGVLTHSHLLDNYLQWVLGVDAVMQFCPHVAWRVTLSCQGTSLTPNPRRPFGSAAGDVVGGKRTPSCPIRLNTGQYKQTLSKVESLAGSQPPRQLN